MATGTTTNFEQSRDEIIQDALANVGAIGPDMPVAQFDGAIRSHAARALNRLVKSIDPEGTFLWRTVRRTFTTIAAQADYGATGAKIAADVIAVDEPMSFMAAGQNTRTPIIPMSRDDFMRLPDRTVQSRAPQFYFAEKTLAQPVTVTFYPIPSTSGDTIEYAAILRSLDFDTPANTPDFPPQWSECLVLGLSAMLAPTYGQVPLADFYQRRFEMEKKRLLDAETEHGPIYFVPWGSC